MGGYCWFRVKNCLYGRFDIRFLSKVNEPFMSTWGYNSYLKTTYYPRPHDLAIGYRKVIGWLWKYCILWAAECIEIGVVPGDGQSYSSFPMSGAKTLCFGSLLTILLAFKAVNLVWNYCRNHYSKKLGHLRLFSWTQSSKFTPFHLQSYTQTTAD